ncbi:hypothetical protein PVL30_000583 [Lodderomyces elongisporus]|uniref:uncharacterized protein n=1 Tax=Lodderomyces elongisporus TaxID=36914 RepID=UPI002926A167|nr:uncharacterized protein PVL30_000583 [Lodderomyces elongisporus]WLF76878.1 hypothetical protein PVL30_000583 [Lodderomyces elongisporus]
MSEVKPVKLSKKEQKSKQFRKSKEEREAAKLEKQESKKRKLEQQEEKAEEKASSGLNDTVNTKKEGKEEKEIGGNSSKDKSLDAVSEGDEPVKKKRKTRRGKKGRGTIVNEDETVTKKAPRFILFVGNLPFDIQQAELIAHFSKCSPDRIRIRSDKGIAFLEFDSDTKDIQSKMELALKLHHTEIRQRRINVELTVGGGGNSETRKEKLKQKNEKAHELRQLRRAEEEKKKKEKSKVSEKDLGGIHPSRAQLMK